MSRYRLRMIRCSSEIGSEQPFALRLSNIFVAALHRNEDGINLFQDLRVAKVQAPAMLSLIVVKENADLSDARLTSITLSPGHVRKLAFIYSSLRKVIGVVHERLALCIKGTRKGSAGCASRVCVVDIDDMKIARADNVTYFAAMGEKITLTIETRTLCIQLIREVMDVPLQRGNRRSVIGVRRMDLRQSCRPGVKIRLRRN